MSIRRPDIVLLVLDTQRADRLSCYGHPRETTPHLDTLAADATRFGRACSPAQWTIPAHASIFTGLYPPAHATVQSWAVLPAGLPTLAERLGQGGYFTAAFCNNPLVGVVNNGLRRGFLSFLNYSGLLTSRPNQAGARPGPIDRYRQFFKRSLSAVLSRIQDAFARSDLLLRFSMTPLMVPLWQTALSFKGNTARSLHDAGRLLIERRGVAPDQPVFCFINLMGAHTPYHPPRPYLEQFGPHVLHDERARRFLRRFNSDIYGWLAPLGGAIDDEDKLTLDAVYDAEVASQDAQVGALLSRLRAAGALDRTLLMVVADHGDHLGEKRLIGHAFSAYNELVHVPLIIRDPLGELPRATTVDHVVSTRRLFHTALAAAGLALPAERALSLARNGGADPEEHTAFVEAVPPENVLALMRRRQPDLLRAGSYDQVCRAVWSAEHKLIQKGEEHAELYHIASDPRETENLIAALPEQAALLRARLEAFARQAGSAAATPGRRHVEDEDEIVQRRLRDLGYME